jgi:hypothetical protein
LPSHLRASLLALLLAAAGAGHADVLRVCDPPDTLSAGQKDTIFRFGAVIKAELERSGQHMALISRSGLDLARFGVRYSHAGFSLRSSPDTPWAVRQLYYACDEKQPRIFDQGMLAFVLGMNEPALGYVSVVLLPQGEADAVESAALDKRQALQVLASTYSANSYPFSLRYQNCNQWVAELLATARGGLAEAENPREQAQAWLKGQGYVPSVIDVGWRPLMWATAFVPWLHNDDHPPEDQAQKIYRVSMPASIEAFVQAQLPGATRLEFCHTERHVVVHRGWTPVAEGCVPGEDDTVVSLD